MSDLKNGLNALTKKKYEKAFRILSPLAKDGNPSAQYYLGYLLSSGLGVIKNEKEADKLRLSSIKIFREQAKNGNKEAISKLGRIFVETTDLENDDFMEELKWLKLASKNGCRESSFLIGNIYDTGEKPSVADKSNIFPIKNKKEAFKWFKISAEQGMAFGMINVAGWLRLGIGTEQNYKESFKWYNIAILSSKKTVNYRYEDIWKEAMQINNRHIREIKKTLQPKEIFTLLKEANEYVQKKTKEGVFDYSIKDDLDQFLEFTKKDNKFS